MKHPLKHEYVSYNVYPAPILEYGASVGVTLNSPLLRPFLSEPIHRHLPRPLIPVCATGCLSRLDHNVLTAGSARSRQVEERSWIGVGENAGAPEGSRSLAARTGPGSAAPSRHREHHP
jgi:hypothetical protein